MAYFVAKELGMRPIEILTTWNCEELLVAYGNYINQKSAEYVESVPEKEWAKHKPEPITWLDRWAVLFVDSEQMKELATDEVSAIDENDFIRAAQSILT